MATGEEGGVGEVGGGGGGGGENLPLLLHYTNLPIWSFLQIYSANMDTY